VSLSVRPAGTRRGQRRVTKYQGISGRNLSNRTAAPARGMDWSQSECNRVYRLEPHSPGPDLTDHLAMLFRRGEQPRGKSGREVDELDRPLPVEHDVLRVDIPMPDIQGVQIRQTVKTLQRYAFQRHGEVMSWNNYFRQCNR